MPAAYAPKSATLNIKPTQADFEIEYSVPEIPAAGVPVATGIAIVFGKSTKKVLAASFEYPSLDELLSQLSVAGHALRARQNLVPQDSIKRNYQMVADGIDLLRNRVEADLETLKTTLDRDVPTVD